MLNLHKMKVCYLAGTLGQGGAERQLYYAVQGLLGAGAAVRVLCLDQGGFWEKPILSLPVPVIWIGNSASRLKRLIRITRELRSDPPDVFQSQHFYTNAYAGIAGRMRNCASIGALRSSGAFDVLSCGRIGGRLNLTLPRCLAANSRSSMSYAQERGVPASRICFFPNVVDTNQFQPAPTPPESFVLLAVGRLAREKRFDRFLMILHRLRHHHGLNVQGLIAGGTRPRGGLRSELVKQANELGLLPDGVQFLGGVADLRPVYQRASVCVLTSDHEGTPNVLLEAMASGLPIVATRVGGVPEIVRHGQDGFLLPPDDLDGLTGAIVQLIRQPGLRAKLGSSARTFVEEQHSVQQIHVHLSRLYETALQNFSISRQLRVDQPLNAVPPTA